MAAPLSKLLKKSQEVLWEEEQETAFRNLKEAITSHPVLTLYDPVRRHEVHTDASSKGIAGVLEALEVLAITEYYCSTTSNRTLVATTTRVRL